MTSCQDATAIVASTVSVHKTLDKFAKKVGNGNWNTAIPVQAPSDEEVDRGGLEPR